MPTFEQTKGDYARMWSRMVVTKERIGAIDAVARRILKNKARYQRVQTLTGVPWAWIAIIHNRESGGDFAGVLHNGEKILGTGRKTKLVPAGRGPFSTWEEAAVDAIEIKGLQKIKSWPIERWLYEGERFNGWGYFNRGVPSAYLWSFSNIYKGGKYVADGVWSSSTWDRQMGIAPLLKRLLALDSSIDIDGDEVVARPAPDPEPAKPITQSRTMQGAGTAATGGTAVMVDNGAEIVTQLEKADGHISAGTVLGFIVGALIVAGALYAAYAKWDERGRPVPSWWPRWLGGTR